MISANLSAIFYLTSGILFILALRGLSSPDTSRQGNYFGIIGMVIAIAVTFLSIGNFSSGFIYVLVFLLIGGSIGAFIAFKIPMTAMPEQFHTHCCATQPTWRSWNRPFSPRIFFMQMVKCSRFLMAVKRG